MQPQPDKLGRRLGQAGDQVRDATEDVAKRGWNDLQPLLDFRLLHAGGIELTVGGLVGTVLVFALAWALSRFLQRTINRYGERHRAHERAALYTLARILHYLLLAAALMLALEMLGIPLGKMAVFLGALGVGLGFGLQAVFSNFVSGLILLFDRSLKVGDFVELDKDVRGTVRAVNMRATRITTNDNIDVLVPNSEFIGGRVVNWTHGSYNRRIRVPFGVSYGVDKEVVKKAAFEACARVPFTLSTEGDRAPQLWLVEFGPDAVQFMLVVWLTEAAARRNVAVRAAYMWELDTAFRQHGIERPHPQRDLHLRSAFGLHGDDALRLLRPEHRDADADAAPASTLAEHERARLSRNDAQADAERGIEEDRADAAQDPEPPDAHTGQAHGHD